MRFGRGASRFELTVLSARIVRVAMEHDAPPPSHVVAHTL